MANPEEGMITPAPTLETTVESKAGVIAKAIGADSKADVKDAIAAALVQYHLKDGDELTWIEEGMDAPQGRSPHMGEEERDLSRETRSQESKARKKSLARAWQEK